MIFVFFFYNIATCGGFLTGMEGNFTSPDYPQKYGNGRKCTWIIDVQKGYKIELKMPHFDIEEGFDYVEVRDGVTAASRSFGRFQGPNKKPGVIVSTSNKMMVELISDDTNSYSGFFAQYRACMLFTFV